MSPSQPRSLPTSKALLTSLVSGLTTSSAFSSNPTAITDSPINTTAAKPNLLTLHALFPSLLLPALDLLDRRLVTRFALQDEPTSHFDDAEETSGDRDGDGSGKNQCDRMIYYVKSNAHRDGRSRYSRTWDVGGTGYEVRTAAWSCTCAAFAFSAYNDGRSYPTYESYENVDDVRGNGVRRDGDEEMLDMPEMKGMVERDGEWQWGGLMLEEDDMPLCKHLLACVLAEQWNVGGSMVEERMVGKEEMAGWAAGWGG